MKIFYNVFSIILVLLYIAGVLFGVYYLTYDAAKIQKVASIFPELIYLVIALSLLGLLGFLFLFLRKESNLEIIYTAAQENNPNGDTNQQTNITDKTQDTEQTGVAKTVFNKIKQDNHPILEASLRAICQHLEAGIGAMYIRNGNAMEMESAYALYRAEGEVIAYQWGEGLVGQVAKDGKVIKLSHIPEGYMEVVSGLGSAFPNYLMLFPIKNLNKEVVAVIELATFKNITGQELVFLEEMALLLAREVESVMIKS